MNIIVSHYCCAYLAAVVVQLFVHGFLFVFSVSAWAEICNAIDVGSVATDLKNYSKTALPGSIHFLSFDA